MASSLVPYQRHTHVEQLAHRCLRFFFFRLSTCVSVFVDADADAYDTD